MSFKDSLPARSQGLNQKVTKENASKAQDKPFSKIQKEEAKLSGINRADHISSKTKINPLAKPGLSNGAQTSNHSSSNQSKDNAFNKDFYQKLSSDANQLSELRGLDIKESRALSHTIANTYIKAKDKYTLGDNEIRRFINHGIVFNEKKFQEHGFKADTDLQTQSSKLISLHNRTILAKLDHGPKLAQHYKQLGFQKDDYGQVTAKQINESFNYIQALKKDPSKRAAKQALVILSPENDMTKKVEELKKSGFRSIFAKAGHERSIDKLEADLNGFDLTVDGQQDYDLQLIEEPDLQIEDTHSLLSGLDIDFDIA